MGHIELGMARLLCIGMGYTLEGVFGLMVALFSHDDNLIAGRIILVEEGGEVAFQFFSLVMRRENQREGRQWPLVFLIHVIPIFLTTEA